jgi:GLPGLI family protein
MSSVQSIVQILFKLKTKSEDMGKFFLIIALLFLTNSYSQKNFKIVFEGHSVIQEERLKSIPEHLRAKFVEQLKSLKKESCMSVQNSKVYFESKQSDEEVVDKSIVETKNPKGGVLLSKDLSTSVSFSAVKMIKDAKTNTYVTRVRKELLTKKLPKVQWKISKKQKKILGYICYEAVTKYKKQFLTVYFTKELKAIASPDTLPFIEGVVLEYNYGTTFVKAVKVNLNPAVIANFL